MMKQDIRSDWRLGPKGEVGVVLGGCGPTSEPILARRGRGRAGTSQLLSGCPGNLLLPGCSQKAPSELPGRVQPPASPRFLVAKAQNDYASLGPSQLTLALLPVLGESSELSPGFCSVHGGQV